MKKFFLRCYSSTLLPAMPILLRLYTNLPSSKLLIFALVIAFNCASYAQTTEEEYNYITKGYQVQLESGLDMKKGYTLTDLGNSWFNQPMLDQTIQKREVSFKGLIRQGEIHPCAIMMNFKRTDISHGANYFLCIPHPKSSEDIWNRALKDMLDKTKDGPIALQQTFIWALMHFSSREATK